MENQNQNEAESPTGADLNLNPDLNEASGQASSDFTAGRVVCDYCDAEIELSPEEQAQGWFTCPECGELTHLGEPPGEEKEAEPELPLAAELVDWVEVEVVSGAEQAALVVAYLQANDIKAHTWQEASGRAMGLSFGELGLSHIVVHESDAEQARTLLEMSRQEELASDDLAEEELSDLVKTGMGVAAVAINPLGAGIAYGLAQVLGDEDEQTNLVECGNCQVLLELSEEEMAQGWYVCPECQHTVYLSADVTCPNCQTELVLDEEELAQGWYRCPECGQVAQIEP